MDASWIVPGVVLRNYRFEEVLGRFNNFRVWKAVNTLINKPVVIRVFHRNILKSNNAKTLFVLEKTSLKQMDHPFIPQLIDCIETKDDTFLIKEYVGANHLSDIVKENGRLTNEKCRRYFQELVLAVEYLHNHDFVIFDDFDYTSVMIDGNDNARVVDYELLKEGSLPPYHDQINFKILSPERLNFVPPELIRGEMPTPAADIWCLGVLLYFMACGKLPFEGDVTNSILNLEPNYPPHLDNHLADLIKKCLRKDPVNRITFGRIKNHLWMPQNNLEEYLTDVLSKSGAGVDRKIVERIGALGFDTSFLAPAIVSGELGDIISVYRHFQRDSILTQISNGVDGAYAPRRKMVSNKATRSFTRFHHTARMRSARHSTVSFDSI